ncbi:MAG TPA: glycosyltransferase family 1 protein [Candidatus Limnocylindrales bacterium]|nr:glycosyltransferase family 1 protein [Candidatus Limnocylindrales bacterium]
MTTHADIVCLSHLRWDFVYQRPNHLMARAAERHRVYFVEEPELRTTDAAGQAHGGMTTPTSGSDTAARMETAEHDGVTVVRPILPAGTHPVRANALLRTAIDRFAATEGITRPWLWYYTPMALPWTEHLAARAVIYDCMDELSGFRFAPAAIRDLERRLLGRANVVFTGGRSLYGAKRDSHPNTFLFPSSVDVEHFRRARRELPDPADQRAIGRPRIGYYGVIDERIDLGLVDQVAAARPDWQLVMVGPLAKIDEADLPRRPNIHWLGKKSYSELPAYLAGWDVAVMPFALNESTRHISPTKTPEYLTGGRPVVSTSVRDVVQPYGELGLVHIADGTEAFVAAIEVALAQDRTGLRKRADRFLASQSWDTTWAQMAAAIQQHAPRPRLVPVPVVAPVAPDRAGRGAGGSDAPTTALITSGELPK